MRLLHKFLVSGAMAAVAAVPLGFSGIAGAQDAGNCGEGGTSVSSTQTNVGGLLGAVAPISIQAVLPVNLPILSPNAQTCNENINEANTGGGHSGSGGGGGVGARMTPATGGSSMGGAVAAVPVGGSPRFAG